MVQERPVGVVGLDDLGKAVIERLVRRGIRVEAYDPKGDLRRSFNVDSPAVSLAPSLTDLGTSCEIILSTLADVAQLRAAAFGDPDRPGFALAMRTGSLIVHFGTGPYKDVLRLTGHLGSGGIGLIDVLSCLPPETSDQPLEMLAGGYQELVDRALPVLEALGSVKRVGPTGTATGLAALRSYVRATRLIALSEAMLIGRHAGIEPATLARVFDGPVATGPHCRHIANGGIDIAGPGFDLSSTSRAVADAVGFSEHIGVSGECIAFARDMLSDALAGDEGSHDESTLLRHFTALAVQN